MTTAEFIKLSLQGATSKDICSSVTRYGDTVYSYGYHYPLARVIGGRVFINNRGYSNTTARHIHWAYRAANEVVSYDRIHGVPLTNGDSLTPDGIKSSATREMFRLKKVMASKKRKDTWVYSDLQSQLDRITKVLEVVA